ncbi:homoserine dehydrogenase [Fontibacillus solani]|uniref:Homoserine dehydrogenase n=1 Tax=Fontibacillus solani TaxID=1572857 RepID=A0A7W3SYE7_9BACL|nr:homoserine dehydrogenase [Fontibacillus solani]MBA9088462.1 homoserine dehydrogenase [Fontibacillus solani]
MNKITVGFLGLGVVGAELVNIIRVNQETIIRNYGVKVEIGKIFIRDMNKKRGTDISSLQLTTNVEEVIDDNEIDIICECMGGAGTEKTKEYIIRSINNNKSIIMSSKKTLAYYGKDIIPLAGESEIDLRYDATVGGGIPIAKILTSCFKGESITKIVGILNATSNFIYSKMENDVVSFKEALKEAQSLGYAENDPTEDIGGFDSLYKGIILAVFAMNKWVDVNQLSTTPFSTISLTDMNYALELGYSIKPLVIFKNSNGTLLYRIGPCLIKKDHIVANTSDNYNMIVIEGSNSGVLGFYGQGAGSLPTASAMFDDLISIIEKNNNDHFNSKLKQIKNFNNVEEYNNSLYWRLTVKNVIGNLSRITAIFSSYKINIEKLIQKNEQKNTVDVVLLTSRIELNQLSNLTDELNSFDSKVESIIPFFED